MAERKNLITMHGKALILEGSEVKEGEKAPDFTVVDQQLNPVKFYSFAGKISLILTVPSLDTSVCSMEVRRFNQEVAKFGKNLETLVISVDLPFAQKRWCGAEGIKNIHVLSDYQKREVGEKYGVLIKGLYILARSAFIIDGEGIIRHVHLVKEVTQEPNYAEILTEVSQLLAGVR